MARFIVSLMVVCGICVGSADVACAADKVGVILPMTRDFARYGDRIRNGIEAARSPTIQYVYEDEACDAKTAVNAFQKLKSADGVKVFLGPWCGSPQVVVASLLERSDSLAVVGSSAPERVFELSGGRMFSVQPSIEAESTFNAREASRLGAKRVVIVFLENDFSRAHESAFRKEFKGEILETLTYTSSDGSALRALATRIKRLNPDTLYVPDGFPLLHGLTKHLANLGLQKLRLMSVYSAHSEEVLSAVGVTGEGLLLSYPRIEQEALNYYPQIAAEVLMYGLQQCPGGTVSCIREAITTKYPFNRSGVLQGEMGLQVVEAGKFIWVKR